MSLWIRSFAFNTLFYITIVTLGLVGLPALLLPRKNAVAYIRFVVKWSLWLLKSVAGIRYEIRGAENLQHGPVIIASKHQSMWETISFIALLEDPAIVLKQELLRIPVYGWFLRKAQMIAVNRSTGASAMRKMLRMAEKAINQKRSVVIFPEGTRAAPGLRHPYRPGIGGLYTHLKKPCIPVALNSGLFWPRRRFLRNPGTIIVEFLPPLPPGLERKTFMRELEQRIEIATDRLLSETSFP